MRKNIESSSSKVKSIFAGAGKCRKDFTCVFIVVGFAIILKKRQM